MSCNTLCPCQFNWPLDTQGSKRDPVTSEKMWLDFAVRFLSREAVGKGRGQETVWSASCKPVWWDAEICDSWKNPTANPKDTKDVLLHKYEALERHLRLEGRFPLELEEEARLWREGKFKELFLLTSLTSLLGKVMGVHAAVIGACAKTEELKAEINQSLLGDIKACLNTSLRATENLRGESKSQIEKKKSTLKRPSENSGKENEELRPIKHQRMDTDGGQLPVPLRAKLQCKKGVTGRSVKSVSCSEKQQNEILCHVKKLLKKREMRKIEQVHLDKKKSQSATLISALNSLGTAVSEHMNSSETLIQNPICVKISEEDLKQLLLGNPVPMPTQIISPRSSVSAENDQGICNTSGEEDHSPSDMSGERNDHTEFQIVCRDKEDAKVDRNQTSIPNPVMTSGDIPHISVISDVFHHLPETLPIYSPDHSQLTEENAFSLKDPVSTSIDVLHSSPNVSSTDPSEASPDACSASVTSRRLKSCETNDSEPCPPISDFGYCSDKDQLDLNSLFSPEEQGQLWEEDGSYLLDRFLSDLDNVDTPQ